MEVFDADGFRQIGGVIIVFLLLGMAVWKFRAGVPASFSRGRGHARLQSAGRLGLTPQHAIHLVRVDGRELLVATHPQGCLLLEATVLEATVLDARTSEARVLEGLGSEARERVTGAAS